MSNEERTAIQAKICELVATDSYTIPEVCQAVKIHKDTYYAWFNDEKSDFSDAIKKAKTDFLNSIAIEAQKSLLKRVKGYEVEETKTVYSDNNGKPKIKERTVTKKHIAPDIAAVIYTLSNVDPANWKNRQSAEITGKNGGAVEIKGEFDVTKLTEDELRRIANSAG
jgi:hypothetical protein